MTQTATHFRFVNRDGKATPWRRLTKTSITAAVHSAQAQLGPQINLELMSRSPAAKRKTQNAKAR